MPERARHISSDAVAAERLPQSQREQVHLGPVPIRRTMGQRPGRVFAVVAVALAVDVAPEVDVAPKYEELARRRLRKMGVVFLEDDDAVNIQSTSVEINRLPSAWTLI